MNARWLRHAVRPPAVLVGDRYGVEQGSRGAFLVAGEGALAHFIRPGASRFLAWASMAERRGRASPVRARNEPRGERGTVPKPREVSVPGSLAHPFRFWTRVSTRAAIRAAQTGISFPGACVRCASFHATSRTVSAELSST